MAQRSELRCANKLFGCFDDEILEIKCKSTFCGASQDVVVIHRFDMRDGSLVSTRKYKNPKKGNSNG